MIHKYKRLCPKCGREITHKRKVPFFPCIIKLIENRLCKQCSLSVHPRGYCNGYWLGKSLSETHKENISKSETGKIESQETKNKKRLAHIERVKKSSGHMYPNHNPNACKMIDEYGKQHGYDFQHAENGGEFHIKELVYWVDGYDKKKNVVIEVYEPSHSNIKKQQRDGVRKQLIVEHLDCEFIELWEK